MSASRFVISTPWYHERMDTIFDMSLALFGFLSVIVIGGGAILGDALSSGPKGVAAEQYPLVAQVTVAGGLVCGIITGFAGPFLAAIG